VSSFNRKSYKKISGRIRTAKRSGKRIFPGRRGDRPRNISFAKPFGLLRKKQRGRQNSGAARGAEPLWKFAEQIWFEAEGRNPTVGFLSTSQVASSFNYKSYKKLSGRIRTAKRSGKKIFQRWRFLPAVVLSDEGGSSRVRPRGRISGFLGLWGLENAGKMEES